MARRSRTPAERHAGEVREQEIGGTAGQRHEDVLMRTLGRDHGLRVATGASTWPGPDVVGNEEEAARAERTHENEEINEKKLERHGDLGGER